MLAITYAYEPEVKALKRLVEASDFESRLILHRWDGKNDFGDNIKLIVNVGFAGALNSDLALGEVVLVDEVMGADNRVVKLDFALQENVQQKKVRLLTRSEPVTSAVLRDQLFEDTKADIVDMEGSFLLMAAKSKSVPLVIFKVVSDMADNDAWQMVKQNSQRWSNILGETVFEYLGNYSRLQQS